MMRIRRDPKTLVLRLATAERVLVVCQGNIIRSPFTAAFISRQVGAHRQLSISSGGLGAVAGTPSPETALRAARRHGIDLSGHAAAAVTPQAVAEADVIFVMDVPQLAALRRRFPAARAKSFLLALLALDTPLEIADPFDGDDAAFHTCFEHIASVVNPIAHALSIVAP